MFHASCLILSSIQPPFRNPSLFSGFRSLFTGVFPNLVRHFEEHFDYFRVELPSGPMADFFARSLQRLCWSIWEVRCNRVKSVRNCGDPCSEWYCVALQPPRITSTVEVFMMRPDYFHSLAEKRDFLKHHTSPIWVFLHDL